MQGRDYNTDSRDNNMIKDNWQFDVDRSTYKSNGKM